MSKSKQAKGAELKMRSLIAERKKRFEIPKEIKLDGVRAA